MKRGRWILIPMVVFLTILFALSIHSAEEDFFKKGRKRGIPFVSGGVGQRERDILKEMGTEYSLKLIFSNKKGEYLSDVIVKILDQKDETILITVSNGPWLFVDLPTGIYHLEASSKADQKRISHVKIEKGRQRVISIQW